MTNHFASDRPIAVDLFAGAGGMSEGLEQAGFHVALACELQKNAAATYRYNHPRATMLEKDVKKLTAKEIWDIIGHDITLVAAGPPCQGFSMAGRRDINDPRSKLITHLAKLICDIRPKFFLIENVVGLLSFNDGKLLKSLESRFSKNGYFVAKRILDASMFGVPQRRRRVFIIGSLHKAIDISSLSAATKPVTVKEAISDLDFLGVGQSAETYKKLASSEYQRQMRGRNARLHNHKAPNHTSEVLKRFSKLRPGQGISDLPKEHRIRKRVMYRLNGHEPARTLTTLPDDCVHYSRDRILTVREFARIQSFPDSYVFLGPKSTGGARRKRECPQYTQVGNAVPPLLAKAVGLWISRA
jgi:DNA (cytosine-5)-methyltransferase 1